MASKRKTAKVVCGAYEKSDSKFVGLAVGEVAGILGDADGVSFPENPMIYINGNPIDDGMHAIVKAGDRITFLSRTQTKG